MIDQIVVVVAPASVEDEIAAPLAAVAAVVVVAAAVAAAVVAVAAAAVDVSAEPEVDLAAVAGARGLQRVEDLASPDFGDEAVTNGYITRCWTGTQGFCSCKTQIGHETAGGTDGGGRLTS